MANRESSTTRKEFLLALKRRGLRRVVFAVSDDHPELKRLLSKCSQRPTRQRCYVHFLHNALDDLPAQVVDDRLIELRWLYDRRNAEEARRDLAAWLLLAGKVSASLMLTVHLCRQLGAALPGPQTGALRQEAAATIAARKAPGLDMKKAQQVKGVQNRAGRR
jgi:hypothetical protein